MLQATFTGVFKELVHRRKQSRRSVRAYAQIEIKLVVEKMNIAMAQHAEKFPGSLEVFGVNDRILNGEVGGGFPRDAVTGARDDGVEDGGQGSEHRDRENVTIGHFDLSMAAHGARIAAETGEIITTA